MKRGSRFHVNESDLLCKARCGFYGNPAWKGYCSVCYKATHGRQQQHSVPTTQLSVEAQQKQTQRRTDLKPEQSFSAFEEKRRQQSERKTGTVKSFFGGSKKIVKKGKSDGESAKATASGPPVSQQRKSELSQFLIDLGQRIYEDISRRVQLFIATMKMLPQSSTVDSWSDAVQDFYQTINDHINTDPLYQDLDESKINDLLDQLEKYLMNRLYGAVFCPNNSDDEQQDLMLQKRIRSLHWVTTQQLDANMHDEDLGVRAALDKSIADIIELDTKKSPKDKLSCIVDCSRQIFEALKLSSVRTAEDGGSSSSVASADDFLPVFIFIILKANPPRLKSNINYITRFACPSRLNSGEGGYFFTNMCCVVDFVEKLNGESLNLSEDEFNSYMSGDSIPEGTNTVYMCDGLRLIHENSLMMKKLKVRQEQCHSNITELEQRLSQFRKEFDHDINELVLQSPLTLKQRRRKADMDSDEAIPTSLPSPLLPQALGPISN